MTDKEKIRAEIERLKESGCASPIVICDTLLAFIDSMQEEPVSDNLEAEIEDYMNRNFSEGSDGCLISDNNKVLGGVTYLDISYIARHFTNWQKHQIMKDAIDAFIYKGGIRLKEWPLPEKCGKHLNPVKVIIIKEDKV